LQPGEEVSRFRIDHEQDAGNALVPEFTVKIGKRVCVYNLFSVNTIERWNLIDAEYGRDPEFVPSPLQNTVITDEPGLLENSLQALVYFPVRVHIRSL
jgi:hypothetical protein